MAGKKKHGKANVYGKGGVFIGTVRTVTAVDGVFRLHPGDILQLLCGCRIDSAPCYGTAQPKDAIRREAEAHQCPKDGDAL